VPFHVVVVGRGTHEQSVGRDPVRDLGLDGHVTFTGYLRGERYATAMALFDAQVFLMPGSDPTCRALREGMALGVPSIAARRGMLPEIVEDGVTGLVIGEGVEPLTDAMRRMAAARDAVRVLGEGAKARAERLFAAPRVAEALEALWRRAGS
jgi:glycosyltransferase involved in cell wall biosynthesis